MKKILVAILLFLFAVPVFATIQFNISPSFNLFSDKRITGQSIAFSILFDLGDMKAGLLSEGGDYTVTNEANSVNYFFSTVSMKGVRFQRDVVALKDVASAAIGLDIGTANIFGLAGSVAVPAGFNQMSPFVDLLGNIVYTPKSSSKVNSSIFLNIGYRVLDIMDVAIPFGAGTRSLADMNSWFAAIGAGIEF